MVNARPNEVAFVTSVTFAVHSAFYAAFRASAGSPFTTRSR
jgi:hypothetical protein